MKRLLLFPLLVSAGCINLNWDFSTPTRCGQVGQNGQYYLGYSDGSLIFRSCDALPARALAPDGAVAWVTSDPVNSQSKPWIGARSTDENVMSAEYSTRQGVILKSNHPGLAYLELYDASMQTVERAEVAVGVPQAVDIAGLPPSGAVVPLLAGSSLFIEYRAADFASTLLGIGGGIVETTGPLQILTPPSASATTTLFGGNARTITTVEVAGEVGDGTVTIHLADVSAVVPLQIVDVAELTSAKLGASTLHLSATGGAEAVGVVAFRDTTAIRGARCQWTVPVGLDAPRQSSSENLTGSPGTAYSFISRAPGTYTATCVVSPTISLSLQIVVGD